METFVKLPDGSYVPERREATTMDLQASLMKVLTKMESMEINIDLKLENVKERMSNIDEKIASRMTIVEDKITQHFCDEVKIDEVLDEHDRKWTEAEKYVDRIHTLESKYSSLQDRATTLEAAVEDLKTKPQRVTFAIVQAVGKKLGWFLLGLLGAAILFSLIDKTFWTTIAVKAAGG